MPSLKNDNKIILIAENYVPGGANKYTEDLVYCLKDNFQKIEIWGNRAALNSFNRERLPKGIIFKKISIYNAGELIKKFPVSIRKALKLFLTPTFFIFNILSLSSLKIKLKKLDPSLVLLCNGGYPASVYLDLVPLFIKSSTNMVMTIVSTPIRKENVVLNLFWKILDKIVYLNCKDIVVNSMAIKHALVSKYQFPEKNISVLKNGIFDQSIARNPPTEIIQIGFISRVERSKGIIELLNAYEKLRLKHKNITLVIAGDGSQSDLITNAALKDPSINYLGHVNRDLHKLLHRIDIFVLPSYQEGLPYSIIEASMAGCAIVATDVGGIPELIENRQTGLLIPSHSDQALFVALDLLVCDHSLRKSLGDNARKNFIDHLSIDKMKKHAKNIFLKDL